MTDHIASVNKMVLGKPDLFLRFDTLEEMQDFLSQWRDGSIRKDGLNARLGQLASPLTWEPGHPAEGENAD